MLFALIMLTQLDGSPIWVESRQVSIIRQSTKQCQAARASGIQIGSVAMCVRETPDQIREKLKAANGDKP